MSNEKPIDPTKTILGSIDALDCSPHHLEQLRDIMAHQERLLAKEAERDFSAAFAKMQAKLPVIDENGIIETADGETAARYATWEDTVDAIRPVLSRHGFSLSFVPGRSPNGYPTVTGVLRHRSGHKETGELELPPDPTGGKNAVQAVGSALSYGQRYVARMLLSLTSRGADDDAGSSTRSSEAFDATAEIEAAPDRAALVAWKRQSRGRLAALPPGDLKAVVGCYIGRQRRLRKSQEEARS